MLAITNLFLYIYTMSVIYSNKRKLFIKIGNLEVLNKALFCEESIRYALQPNIEGHYEISLFNDKDFDRLKSLYEDEIMHIEFIKRYRAGELQSTFNWIKKLQNDKTKSQTKRLVL